MDNRLTSKEFWVTAGQTHKFSRHILHGIDFFIKRYIPRNENGNCIEIGSYPGPHLATFGDMGYKLNGIDFHPDNSTALPAWLNSQGYKTGEFLSIDFFEFEIKQKYDVVASFGFIEHFIDYKEVLVKHASLVGDNGYIIVTTPNFRGWIQYWLHNNFDKKNLAHHNTESMNPSAWKKLLEALHFEIIYYGYFGDFWFWHSHEKLPAWKRNMLWVIERIIQRARKMLWFQSPAFSAYAGIVARKSCIKYS